MTAPRIGQGMPTDDSWIARRFEELQREISEARAAPPHVRSTATYTTAALAAGVTEYGSVTLAIGFRLIKLQTSAACRVRLYGNAADQTTDAARAWGVDPVAGLSLMLDYLTLAAMTAELSPLADGASTEATPTTSTPISITATGAGAVTVTLTYVPTE